MSSDGPPWCDGKKRNPLNLEKVDFPLKHFSIEERCLVFFLPKIGVICI